MFVPTTFFIIAFPFVFGRHIPNMITSIFNKAKLNSKFKQIFDNLEETILIINVENYSLSYVNNYFYMQFKDIIIHIPDLEEKHNYFIEMKIFEEYNNNENKIPLTLKKIINL